MQQPKLHLASASPRRREILTSLGISFSHAGVDMDEARLAGEAVPDMVVRLARDKALAAAADGCGSPAVLGADTAVVLAGQPFGKPSCKDDSIAMLTALSGRSHQVMTAVALVTQGGVFTATSTTEVRFRDIDPDEAEAYWQSGEPRDKAGGYAIQGIGGIFVESLHGSYSGVVGLPVFETAGLLRQAGVWTLVRSN